MLKTGATSVLITIAIIAASVIPASSENSEQSAEQPKTPYTKIAEIPCGAEPKQVIFSPDNNYIYIPLMEEKGYQIYDVRKKNLITCTDPLEITSEKYFVEGIFVNRNDTKRFLISQLTKAVFVEYDVTDPVNPKYLRAVPTGGSWPKVLTYSPSLDCVAVSNWTSNSVTIIDYETGKVRKKLKGFPVPRGLAFTADGKYLLIASYEGGTVTRISTSTWKADRTVTRAKAAMRHIVLHPDGVRCYVSDMAHSLVYEMNIPDFKITRVIKVEQKPNTIDLSKSGKYLFVSNRGPNNPEGYTKRSPKCGCVQIFDTETYNLIGRIPGGTQPTGLDVSSDDRYLAFSNFQDNTIELYDLQGLTGK